MRSRIILTGLLSLSLTACGALSKAPQAEPAPKPSPALLADCPIPVRDGSDNAALARLAQALRLALVNCNDDKAALRELFNGR